MKNKKLIFNILTVFFVIILITWFTELNYQDLSFSTNRNAYMGITTAVMMIIVMQMTKKSIKDKSE